MNIYCKCGHLKFFNKQHCCINCNINNSHNYLCTKYISTANKKKVIYRENIYGTNPYNKHNKIKTVIGKNSYLFLINDVYKSLENHCDENYIFDITKSNIYNKFIESKKIFLFVFPDKEIICKQYLPDIYNITNRKKLDYYKTKFNNLLYDLTSDIDVSYFSKTDTHINIIGMYKIHKLIVKYLIDNLKIIYTVKDIIFKEHNQRAVGDLINPYNFGSQIAHQIYDINYKTNYNTTIFNKLYKVSEYTILDKNCLDISNTYVDKIIDWETISNNIFYFKNNESLNKQKVVILYDSFLLSTMRLYSDIFYETYFIKHIFMQECIDIINPDSILEFRIERFLL